MRSRLAHARPFNTARTSSSETGQVDVRSGNQVDVRRIDALDEVCGKFSSNRDGQRGQNHKLPLSRRVVELVHHLLAAQHQCTRPRTGKLGIPATDPVMDNRHVVAKTRVIRHASTNKGHESLDHRQNPQPVQTRGDGPTSQVVRRTHGPHLVLRNPNVRRVPDAFEKLVRVTVRWKGKRQRLHKLGLTHIRSGLEHRPCGFASMRPTEPM